MINGNSSHNQYANPKQKYKAFKLSKHIHTTITNQTKSHTEIFEKNHNTESITK